ncbi:MAG: site-specific DNA-methyltransferase, partial [Sphingomonadales bacterium]|nr:site-specific DNA-methyltransferase [Sphingomonadales bacterium]
MLDNIQVRSPASETSRDVPNERPMRSLWIGQHRIIEGDCESALDLLEAGSVDVVVTSPPYNLGIKYSQYEDSLEIDKYLEWMERIATKLENCLSADGSIFLNVSGSSANPWIAMDVANVFRKSFCLQNNITWVKS